MRLNIEQYEYMVGPNPGAGIKLLIHDNTEVPLVRDLGNAVPPGTHAYVGIQIVQVRLAPRRCRTKKSFQVKKVRQSFLGSLIAFRFITLVVQGLLSVESLQNIICLKPLRRDLCSRGRVLTSAFAAGWMHQEDWLQLFVAEYGLKSTMVPCKFIANSFPLHQKQSSGSEQVDFRLLEAAWQKLSAMGFVLVKDWQSCRKCDKRNQEVSSPINCQTSSLMEVCLSCLSPETETGLSQTALFQQLSTDHISKHRWSHTTLLQRGKVDCGGLLISKTTRPVVYETVFHPVGPQNLHGLP